ncbi:MAG: hypothetical protein IPH88_18165 [Bacteroidales bacterium]|nr:hypothetical protein [Bacteroidales bacterium]
MKTFAIVIIVIHALIHLMGFTKAFKLAEIPQITQTIGSFQGLLWLATTLLFLGAAILYAFNSNIWWIPGILAIAISQLLIVMNWKDACYGTILNVVILLPVLLSMFDSFPGSFRNRYREEVQLQMKSPMDTAVLTETDIAGMPAPVQKYLRYTGSIGKPRISNFNVHFGGEMMFKPDGKWTKVKAEQYSFYQQPARIFMVSSSLFGLPFEGLHIYVGNSARMQIRLLSAFNVADAKGEKMIQSENVTMLNDMCLLAPATLIDKNIRWEPIDNFSAKAFFTNNGVTVSATLFFNESGQLINFSSADRFYSPDGKTYISYVWSTPCSNYKEFQGRKLAIEGKAVWQRPEGDYTYASFKLEDIRYNSLN